jgi:hypothetical protein
VLGITSSEEVAACPRCGMFYERYKPSYSRWPAVWQVGIALCGPMFLVALVRLGQWLALRADQKALFRFCSEAYSVFLPFAWFLWPVACAVLLAKRYAPLSDRWMSTIGLAIAGMVGNTAIMLVILLAQVLV